eukprot:Skav218213  [mRNA]  locus=scaffold1375:65745:65918:- [translate_table: standard]
MAASLAGLETLEYFPWDDVVIHQPLADMDREGGSTCGDGNWIPCLHLKSIQCLFQHK